MARPQQSHERNHTKETRKIYWQNSRSPRRRENRINIPRQMQTLQNRPIRIYRENPHRNPPKNPHHQSRKLDPIR